MDVYEFVFIIQFLAFICLTLVKLYNLFSKGEAYDLRYSFLIFITALIMLGTGMVITILEYNTILYPYLFRLEVFLFGLHVPILFIEILLNWLRKSHAKPTQRYNALQVYKAK